MTEATAEQRKLLELFFCYNRKRAGLVKEQNKLLAHYTTAETALNILSNRNMWLRNLAVMNDVSELEYGRHVIGQSFANDTGKGLLVALDTIHAGLAQEVVKRYDARLGNVRESVFVSSLCEHRTGDYLGRLSMWRAYGGPVAGVALVFKGHVVDLEIPDLGLDVSPVLYGGIPEFTAEIAELTSAIMQNLIFLKQFDLDTLANVATHLLQFAMFTTKHPAFSEEEEWRVVHRPYESSSVKVVDKLVSVRGIPQTIYQVPFHNPDKDQLFNLPDLDLDLILDHVLIGPCAYPETVVRAFQSALEQAGVKDIKEKERVRVSWIPLRQQW